MTRTTAVIEKLAIPERLRQRFETLSITAAVLRSDGQATTVGPGRWIEQLILDSPLCAAAIRQAWPQLSQQPGGLVELWPGVRLAPLPLPRRRRAPGAVHTQALAAILVGPEFLDSEQFQALCAGRHWDAAATLARARNTDLVGPAEARRLASVLAWLHQDAAEIEQRYGEIQALSSQLGESYEELSLLYKLSTSMTVDQPPAQFLTEACLELQQTAGLRWMALLLIDQEPRLNELAGQVFVAGSVECDAQLLKRVGQMLMLRQPIGATPLVVDDTQTLQIPYLPRLARQLLVVSLLREERMVGILFGGDKLDGSHISSVDSKLCNSLANSLAIFLENMMLFEDMQAMFMGTLHALTNSIDAKDSYTFGHSERVAMVAQSLARVADLDEHIIERVYIAGLVHDLGKIGVPEAVLCKPGELTAEEFSLIRMHPEIGARILQDIRQMQDLIPGVLHHHERWDGRGYPGGLAGEEIPLLGRLIALADSFDAMSSNRTYRQSLAHEKVLGEIARCSSAQFDPKLAKLFLSIDFTAYFQLAQRHQSQQARTAAPAVPTVPLAVIRGAHS